MGWYACLHAYMHAVPFEEDDKRSDVWFFDHDYVSHMFAMFRKINGV